MRPHATLRLAALPLPLVLAALAAPAWAIHATCSAGTFNATEAITWPAPRGLDYSALAESQPLLGGEAPASDVTAAMRFDCSVLDASAGFFITYQLGPNGPLHGSTLRGTSCSDIQFFEGGNLVEDSSPFDRHPTDFNGFVECVYDPPTSNLHNGHTYDVRVSVSETYKWESSDACGALPCVLSHGDSVAFLGLLNPRAVNDINSASAPHDHPICWELTPLLPPPAGC
jgi:hypothetical protein